MTHMGKWALLLSVLAGGLFGAAPSFAQKIVDEEYVFESLDDYEKCQQYRYGIEECNYALQDWVDAHPEDAFAAGKMVRGHMNHWAAVPYFATSEAMQADGFCEDEDVRLAVVSALALPDGEVVVQAQHLAFDRCKGKFDEAIRAELGDENVFAHSCRNLDDLTKLQTKRCAAL